MNSYKPYVLGWERNVVHVDFSRKPDPPAPKFPGAAALRTATEVFAPVDALAGALRNRSQPPESISWATSS